VLAGEKAGQKPAGAFVGSSEKAVEGTMLPGHSAVGVSAAGRALTSMDEPPCLLVEQTHLGQTVLLGHWTLPPFGQRANGPKLFYSTYAEVVVEQ
jgi:hypothetical protein